jgi:hypothetical protein
LSESQQLTASDDLDPVISMCPRCEQARLQCYEREEVIDPLRTGAPIKAFCDICVQEWELSPEERAELAELMVRQT